MGQVSKMDPFSKVDILWRMPCTTDDAHVTISMQNKAYIFI